MTRALWISIAVVLLLLVAQAISQTITPAACGYAGPSNPRVYAAPCAG